MSSKAKFQEHHGDPFLVQASPGFLERVPDPETPETLLEKQEEVLKSELGRIMAALPPTEASAILRWVHGETQAQIADSEGVTQAAISIRAKRGLERLFELRDNGGLSTLKFIWDGLTKARAHFNKEVEMERATNSDVELPLGEELGEVLGAPITLPALPPEPVDDEPAPVPEPPPAPKPRPKRQRLSYCERPTPDVGVVVRLNQKEDAILQCVDNADDFIHIKGIQRECHLSNLEVRNSLRKLVRNGFLSKLGKGRYAAVS